MYRQIKMFTYSIAMVVVILLFLVIAQWSFTSTTAQTRVFRIGPDDTNYDVIERLRSSSSSTSPSVPPTQNSTQDLQTIPDKHSSLGESATLTRWGKELSFNAELCPPESPHVTGSFTNVTPLHDDCPTVFIVGARKGGTTSLYQYLSKHPEFTGVKLDAGPRAGETFYFERHDNSKFRWPKYRHKFRNVINGTISGDSSVGNLVACHVPKLMLQMCGTKPRIIMLLRNPIDRFVSNYLMRVRLAHAYRSSDQAMESVGTYLRHVRKRNINIDNLQHEWLKLRCLFGVSRNLVFEGVYYVHLLNWLCNFPQENIMVVNSEEFFRNATRVLAQVLNFVGLSPLSQSTLESITSDVYNNGSYSLPTRLQLSVKQRTRLMNVFKPYNNALFELLNWSSLEWN